MAVFAVGARLPDAGRLRHRSARADPAGTPSPTTETGVAPRPPGWRPTRPPPTASTAPRQASARTSSPRWSMTSSCAAPSPESRSSRHRTVQLAIDEGTVMLELDFADGWTCVGNASAGRRGIIGRKLQRGGRIDRGRHADGPAAAEPMGRSSATWRSPRPPASARARRLHRFDWVRRDATIRAGSPRIPRWRDQRTRSRRNLAWAPAGRESAPSSGHSWPIFESRRAVFRR